MDLSDTERQHLFWRRRRYDVQLDDVDARRVLAEVLRVHLVAATLARLPGDPAPAPAGRVAVRFHTESTATKGRGIVLVVLLRERDVVVFIDRRQISVLREVLVVDTRRRAGRDTQSLRFLTDSLGQFIVAVGREEDEREPA